MQDRLTIPAAHVTRHQCIAFGIAVPMLWLATTVGRADWPSTGGDKVVQGVAPIRPCALTASPTPLIADNFTCRMPGEILGIHVWGGWRGDNGEDPWTATAQFFIALYEDGAPGGAIPTEPAASPVWSDTFDPTAYKIKKQSGPTVTFYDPSNLTSAGTKSDVYLYNFYPKLPNVFRQQGTQTTPRIYWLAVGLAGGAAGKSFGWQGADALGDGARVRQVPGVWDPLTDPDGQVTDRAFAVTTAMLAGFNKTCVNLTGQTADGLQIELEGLYEVYQTYNGWPCCQWAFESQTTTAGNTLLHWTGTLLAGEANHFGFLVPVTSTSQPKVKSIAWVKSLGGGLIQPIGCPSQFIAEYNKWLSNIELINTLVCSPPTLKYVGDLRVEYYDHPVPLEQLNAGVTTRNPIQTDVLPAGPLAIPGAGRVSLHVPPAPANASYAVLIAKVGDTAVLTNQAGASTDFFLLPIEPLGAPVPLIAAQRDDVGVVLSWSAAYPGLALYESQELGHADWNQVPALATTADGVVSLRRPLEGTGRFFRLQEAPGVVVVDRAGDFHLYHPDFQENHGLVFPNQAAIPPELDILSVETEQEAGEVRFHIRTAGRNLPEVMADRSRLVQFGLFLPACSATNGLVAATDREGQRTLIFSPDFRLLGTTAVASVSADSLTLTLPGSLVSTPCDWAAFSAYSPQAQAFYPTPLDNLVFVPIVDTVQRDDSQVLNVQVIQSGTGQQCHVTGLGAYFCPPAPSLPGKQPLPGLPSVLGWKFTETHCLDRSVSLWCAGAFGRYVEVGASGGWVARCPFCGGQNFCQQWDLDGDGCPELVNHVVYDGGRDDDGDGCQDVMVYSYSFQRNLVTILNLEYDPAGNLSVNDPDPSSPHPPFATLWLVPGPHPGPLTHPPGGCP